MAFIPPTSSEPRDLARLAYLQQIVAVQATQGSVSAAVLIGFIAAILVLWANLALPYVSERGSVVEWWHIAAAVFFFIAIVLAVWGLSVARTRAFVETDPLATKKEHATEEDVATSAGILQEMAKENEDDLLTKDLLVAWALRSAGAGVVLGFTQTLWPPLLGAILVAMGALQNLWTHL